LSVFTYGQFNVDILKNDDDGTEDIEVLIDKTIEYGTKYVEEQSGWESLV